MLTMHAVKSSNVHSLGYDPETRELHVTFKSGGTFIYEDVPPELGNVAHEQDSIGTFLHSKVKTAFKFSKLGEKKPDAPKPPDAPWRGVIRSG
jgi:hypothetical protein